MSEFSAEVKVKVEKDVGEESSLGRLMCSYDDTDSEDGFSGAGNCERKQPNEESMNPEYDTDIKIKDEPGVNENLVEGINEDSDNQNHVDIKEETGVIENMTEGMNEENNQVDIKEEPGIEKLTDFASIRQQSNNELGANRGAQLELGVEDFLEESYVAPRKVKVEVESGTEDSESDSEDSVKEIGDEEEDDEDDQNGQSKDGKRHEGTKGRGEQGIYDLPPIEDLHISVPHEECKPIGVIKSVVEPLVIVEAALDTPALNLDSVLFLDQGDRALGHIFDVIGPVKQPLYCVRFNSMAHIEKYKVEVGMPVYCAPKTPYTSYVFLAQLRRMKGSDASWINDIEPPVEEQEFSDDEMERIAKKKKKNKRKNAQQHQVEGTIENQEQNTGEANQFRRGMKRHHHNPNYTETKPQQSASSSSGEAGHSLPRPPFMPPLVPGFVPTNYQMRNWHPRSHYSHNHNQHRRGFPRSFVGNNNNNHQRGLGAGRGGAQPFPPRPQMGFPQYPPSSYPTPGSGWCPPPQWQNQLPTQYNFSRYNAPQQCYRPSPPQPPPPPPPPGDTS